MATRTGDSALVDNLPRYLVFLLCEDILLDDLNGKHTLVGVLDDVRTSGLPVVCPILVVYAELTGAVGVVHLTLRLVRRLDPSGRAAVTLSTWRFPDTFFRELRAVVRVSVRLRDVALDEAGDYWFLLESSGVPIVARRFTVQVRKPT